MGFFDIFWKTWQVRKSIQIQESLESAFENALNEQELNNNLPQIIDELTEVNLTWEEELEKSRNQNKKN